MGTTAGSGSDNTGAIAAAGMAALGGLFGGLGTGQLSAQAQKEQYTLNKRNLANAEAQQADTFSRQTQTNPLRDQAIFNLSKILGTSPAAFNPVNFGAPTNAGQQGAGGPNINAMTQALGTYKPGAGGVNSNVQQMILNRLGYGNTGTGTLFDSGSNNATPPATPPDQLTNGPGAAVTQGATIGGGGSQPGQSTKGSIPGLTAAAPSAYAQPAAPPTPSPSPSTSPFGSPGSGGTSMATNPAALAAQRQALMQRLGLGANLRAG